MTHYNLFGYDPNSLEKLTVQERDRILAAITNKCRYDKAQLELAALREKKVVMNHNGKVAN